MRAAWRLLVLGFIATWAAMVWAGRELHPVLVGGYSRGDDRHPMRRARRIARLEHAVFPDEVFEDHLGIGCQHCDPDVRRQISDTIAMPRKRTWRCLTCQDTGYDIVWRRHWEDTGHPDFAEYDEWHDAYDEAKANGRRR